MFDAPKGVKGWKGTTHEICPGNIVGVSGWLPLHTSGLGTTVARRRAHSPAFPIHHLTKFCLTSTISTFVYLQTEPLLGLCLLSSVSLAALMATVMSLALTPIALCSKHGMEARQAYGVATTALPRSQRHFARRSFPRTRLQQRNVACAVLDAPYGGSAFPPLFCFCTSACP